MKRAGGRGRVSSSRWPVWPLDVRERWLGADAVALRNAPFALFVAAILAYGAALAWYTLDRFDLVNLIREGYWDDAFYYFQIAYHMAEGRFSTFDGGITRTNGYHPLWLFLITPFYWAFDKTEALFAIKALEIMLLAGGVALVVVAARVARLPWILLFAVLPTLCAQDGMLYGLEAALVLFMLGLLLLAMCLFADDPARWKWPLAVVVFALPWARLEWAVVAVAATAALGFLERSGRLSCASRRPPPNGRAGIASRGGVVPLLRLRAAVPLAAAFAGVLVYFAYNGIVFGGVVPVSGAVKAEVLAPQAWDREGGYSLAKSFGAFSRSEPFDGELLTALEVCVYALLAWWLVRGSRRREDALLLAFTAGVFGLAAGHLAKFAQSVLFLYPQKGVSLWEWYFVPAYLMEALAVPLRCCVAIYVIRRLVGPRLPRTSDVLRLAAIVVAMVVLVAKVDVGKPFRFVDTGRSDLVIDYDLRSYMGAAVVSRLLPEGTLVGASDSGVVGYFSRLPVMNWDGMVNSYDYKEALKEGDVEIELFWRRHGLFHFGNVYCADGCPGWGEAGIMLYEAARASRRFSGTILQFKLLRYDSRRLEWTVADRAAWFRDRMALHLEWQADGTGLLVEGRTVQAFAWGCTGDQNEVAVWTFGGKVGAVSGWTQTADDLCSSEILLPHGHVGPLHVRRVSLVQAAAGLAGGGLAIRADSPQLGGFDVYLGHALAYVKAACEWADVDTPFFLHLVPADDFDGGREVQTTFMLEKHGGRFCRDRETCSCLATVSLPRYRIAEIRTGQCKADGCVWEGEISDSWLWKRL